MEMLIGKSSEFLRRCMLFLFLALCVVALYLGGEQGDYCLLAFLGAAVLFGLSLWLLPPAAGLLARLGALRLWGVLTLLCVLVKGAWVALVRVPVEGDYSVFQGYAWQMSQWGLVYGGRYMALFPHIYGYASFLSGCFRLFGTGELTAQWVNVALTTLSGTFLFLLFRRNLSRACFVYGMWIACPSQSLYNTLVLSEPLYTTLLLGFLWLVGELETRERNVKRGCLTGVITGMLGGLLLRWLNMVRPVAAILVIALFLWRLLLVGKEGRSPLWAWFLAALVGAYLLTGSAADSRVARMAEEPPATTPGYSVLVGLNQGSSGRWNQEDSEVLSLYSDTPGSTAQGVQEAMWEKAKERARSGELDYPLLLREKLRVFWGWDDACVGYCTAGLPHFIRYQLMCNGFWYFSLLLGLLGGVGMWRRRERSHLLLAPLYVLGLTLAQLLVEVAGRYHYSITPMLLAVGACGLFPTQNDDMDTEERI